MIFVKKFEKKGKGAFGTVFVTKKGDNRFSYYLFIIICIHKICVETNTAFQFRI